MPTPAEQVRAVTTRVQRSRWATPVFAVLLGLVALAIQSARDDVRGGVASLVIMTIFAVVLLLFAGRSETVSLIRGDAVDERRGLIQQKALAATGSVLTTVLVAGFFVELARGADDVMVWSSLCSVAGVTFAASLLVLSRRS
jgi:hypothetical protein